MKKIYIQPQSAAIIMQCKIMLTASRFTNTADEQNIIPDDEVYNEGFTVKNHTWDFFEDEW